MTKPKYEIGDRIPGSPFIVRGLVNLKSGGCRYFIQILDSDNTFVGTEEEIERAIALTLNETPTN